ncbi:MAG: methylmalonyl-CoA mutase family protein [Dehalococcoidia bacterium]|nr:methylmalonyl-CoA mutase family protein [Dehalococcoidia bacterium]MBE0610734.1 methylmalonyl-CoA mutase family protein [Dehalococcoidia bacterium]
MSRESVRQKVQEWEEQVIAKTLAKFPERKPKFETTAGIEVKRVFSPADVDERAYLEKDGLPGGYPFTRGVQPTMYRSRFWTMRQYAGFGTAEESNQRYRYLLKQGQTGLSVAFDLPTQIGYDSDDPMATGEVGKVGVAIDSIEDMLTLFDGIPLDKVTTSMTINATASTMLAFYVAVGKHQGVPPEKLGGTVQNDILKEYIARGTYIYPPQPSMRLITDVFAYCKDTVPQWNTISISGYHMREAGCTAAQEIAFTLADGISYVDAALSAGLDIDDFAGRLSFFFACHNNFLEEVAKFRAARRLWAHIMRDRFNAKSARSQMLRFHTQTGGATLTAQQPENNIVRTAVQALAAVLGGTQSLHTNSMDEALALPTEKAVQIALRTQQILAYENGVGDVVDPLGGSYYVEDMTNRLEAEAREYIETIDKLGGSLVAIEQGFQQKEIQEAAYRYQMQVEAKERVIVGVNDFINHGEESPDLLRVDPSIGMRQIEKLRALRARRDGAAVEALLAKLEGAAKGTANLLPIMVECVEARVTLGEISHRLRRVWGEQREPVFI